MLLTQGKFWRASVGKANDVLVLSLLGDSLPEDYLELRDLKIEIPLAKWNPVLKHVRSDRKLLGGVLLGFAKNEDRLAAALANDRLFLELQRVVLDASVALVEEGLLSLTSPAAERAS